MKGLVKAEYTTVHPEF